MKQIPGPSLLEILSKTGKLNDKPWAFLYEMSLKYGKIYRVPLPFSNIIVVNDPVVVQYIFKETNTTFNKQTILWKYSRKVVGKGLGTSEGALWKNQRTNGRDFFKISNLKLLSRQIVVIANESADSITSKNHPEIEITQPIMEYTLRVLMRCIFASDFNYRPFDLPDLISNLIYRFNKVNRLLIPSSLPIVLNNRFKKRRRKFYEFILELINSYKSHEVGKNSLLNAIVDLEIETNKDLIDEISTYIITSVETTSATISWTLYLLAKHPYYQTIIANEILENNIDKNSSYDEFMKLHNLKNAVYESLRLYPPVWGSSRNVIVDTLLNDYKIPSGSMLIVSPYTIHRSPDLWDNPQDFNPSRFNHLTHTDLKMKFIPFGSGPRTCIGAQLAVIESVAILALVLKKYTIHCKRKEISIDSGLRAKNGIYLSFAPIK